MCECKEYNWHRDWRETQNGRYPASEHAPGCSEYKLEKFSVLEYDGVRCVMEPTDAVDMLADEGKDDYQVSTVMLTRDQFGNMPVLQGF